MSRAWIACSRRLSAVITNMSGENTVLYNFLCSIVITYPLLGIFVHFQIHWIVPLSKALPSAASSGVELGLECP